MSLARALREQEDRLSDCVHCGFCLPACPTYTRLGDEADSPRGRLYLMRAVVEGRLDAGSEAFRTHIDRCLGCRACEPVCPSGVEYGDLLERAREVAAGSHPPPALARGLLRVMGTPSLKRLFMAAGRLLRATRLPDLASRLLPSRGPTGRLRLALGMLAATLPGARSPEVLRRDAAEEPAPSSAGPSPRSAGRVALLRGCVQEGLFGEVNRATARVLSANGYEVVDAPGQVCCGALQAHGGERERAGTLARRNIAAFERADVEHVAVNAAGCGAAMKDYHELLAGDPGWSGRARRFVDRVRDVSELLADAGPRRGGDLPVRVAYDPPCHLLHAQRVETPPLRVLGSIPGLELVELRDAGECCGGAGIYGLTHPDLGGRIGSDKAAAVREGGVGVVATGNPGCIMQIGAATRAAGLEVTVLHPIQLLDESYRRGGVYGERA